MRPLRRSSALQLILVVVLGYVALIVVRAPLASGMTPSMVQTYAADGPPGAAGSGYTYNCTNAPGPAAAYPAECVGFDREGHAGQGGYSIRVRSAYYYHNPVSGVGSSVCDRQHELAYFKGGLRRTMQINPPSCLNPATVLTGGDFVTFEIPTIPDRDKSLCTRAKNSATSGNWTPYACIAGSALPKILAN